MVPALWVLKRYRRISDTNPSGERYAQACAVHHAVAVRIRSETTRTGAPTVIRYVVVDHKFVHAGRAAVLPNYADTAPCPPASANLSATRSLSSHQARPCLRRKNALRSIRSSRRFVGVGL